MKAGSGIIKIIGDVAPYSGTGESRVSIIDGEKEYRVAPRGAGIDLIDHISASVEVEGIVAEDEDNDGELYIQVRAYRLLDAFDDDEWYDDDE